MRLNVSQILRTLEDGTGREVTKEKARELGLPFQDGQVRVVLTIALIAETPMDEINLARLLPKIKELLVESGFEQGQVTPIPSVQWADELEEGIERYIC